MRNQSLQEGLTLSKQDPIIDYVYLAYYYRMNPTQFISDMLKRIEKRNVVQIRTNREGKEFVVHGITAGEKQTLDLFRNGNLNPRAYSTKNEEVVREITEGLNLPKKKPDIDYNSPKLSQLTKSNRNVIAEFFKPKMNQYIKNWGSRNLRIESYNNGWALVNYNTYLAWRTLTSEYYINKDKYSPVTHQIQSVIYRLSQNLDPSQIHYVSEDDVYQAAGHYNPKSFRPYGTRMWESRQEVIKLILRSI